MDCRIWTLLLIVAWIASGCAPPSPPRPSGDDDDADDDAGDDDAGDDDTGDDDTGDDDTGDDDTGDDDTTGDDDVADTTIFEIQQGSIAEQTDVAVHGVVATTGVTEPFSYCSYRGFWVQDPAGGPYSGIFVWFEDAMLPGFTVDPGDELSIEGTYEEYYDVSEIGIDDPADVVFLGSATIPPAEAILDPCSLNTAEEYEGVPVQVSSVSVTGTISDVGYGMFEVDSCLLVDSLFFPYTDCSGTDETPDPPLGQAITSVTGPLHYSYSEFKLEPPGPGAFQGWTP